MRIVGGKFRGRKIPVPQKGVRPTSERVREAVMSILGNDWSGRRVLDCFAGSGAMGFEALSRGAQHVHFVDSSAAVCRHLSKVSELLKVETLVKVQKANAAEALNSLAARGQHFDILFFDPPYGQQLLDTVLEHAQNLITSTSVVVALWVAAQDSVQWSWEQRLAVVLRPALEPEFDGKRRPTPTLEQEVI